MNTKNYTGSLCFQLFKAEYYMSTDSLLTVSISEQGLQLDIPEFTKDPVVLYISLDEFSLNQITTLNYFLQFYKLNMINFEHLNVLYIILQLLTINSKLKVNFLQLYTHIDLFCSRIGLNVYIVSQKFEDFIQSEENITEKVICLIGKQMLFNFPGQLKFQPLDKPLDTEKKVTHLQQIYNEQLAKTSKIITMQKSVSKQSSDDEQQTTVQKHEIAFIFAISAFMLIQGLNQGQKLTQKNIGILFQKY